MQIVPHLSIIVIGNDDFLSVLQFLCKFCVEDLASNQQTNLRNIAVFRGKLRYDFQRVKGDTEAVKVGGI